MLCCNISNDMTLTFKGTEKPTVADDIDRVMQHTVAIAMCKPQVMCFFLLSNYWSIILSMMVVVVEQTSKLEGVGKIWHFFLSPCLLSLQIEEFQGTGRSRKGSQAIAESNAMYVMIMQVSPMSY